MGGRLAGGDAQAPRRLDRGAGKADRRNRKADRGGGQRRLICLPGLGSAGALRDGGKPGNGAAKPQKSEQIDFAPGNGASGASGNPASGRINKTKWVSPSRPPAPALQSEDGKRWTPRSWNRLPPDIPRDGPMVP